MPKGPARRNRTRSNSHRLGGSLSARPMLEALESRLLLSGTQALLPPPPPGDGRPSPPADHAEVHLDLLNEIHLADVLQAYGVPLHQIAPGALLHAVWRNPNAVPAVDPSSMLVIIDPDPADARLETRVERPEIGMIFHWRTTASSPPASSGDVLGLPDTQPGSPTRRELRELPRPHGDLRHAQALAASPLIVINGSVAPHDPADFYRLSYSDMTRSLELKMLPSPSQKFTGSITLYDSNWRMIGRVDLGKGPQDLTLRFEPTGVTPTAQGSSIYLGVENGGSALATLQSYSILISRQDSSQWTAPNSPGNNVALPEFQSGPVVGAILDPVLNDVVVAADTDQTVGSLASTNIPIPSSPLIATALPTRAAPAFGGVLNQGDSPKSTDREILDAIDVVLNTEFANANLKAEALANTLGGVPLRSVASHSLQFKFLRPDPSRLAAEPPSLTPTYLGPIEAILPESPPTQTISDSRPTVTLSLEVGLQVGVGLLATVALPEVQRTVQRTKRTPFRRRVWSLATRS